MRSKSPVSLILLKLHSGFRSTNGPSMIGRAAKHGYIASPLGRRDSCRNGEGGPRQCFSPNAYTPSVRPICQFQTVWLWRQIGYSGPLPSHSLQ